MESPTPVPRYIPQNSKKRVFVSGSSSLSAYKDVEVLEIPPPINRASKPRPSSKQNEVTYHEIIDVDMEDCDDDVMLTDGAVVSSAKGKEVLANSSVGSNSLVNDESGSDIMIGAAGLHDSVNADDSNSNLFYGEDEWIDTYYDDILFDEYENLESHFDHMDIPPGVEAPFPWLPNSPKNDMKLPKASTSTYQNLQIQTDGVNLPPGLNSSLSSSSNEGKLPSKCMEPGQGQKKPVTSKISLSLNSQSSKGGSSSHRSPKEYLHAFGKSKRKPRTSNVAYSSYYSQFPSARMYLNPLSGGGSYPTLNMPVNPLVGGGSYTPAWQDLPLNMFESSMGPQAGLMSGSSYSSWAPHDPVNNISVGTSMPTKVDSGKLDEIIQNFESFKKFETVEDCSDHYYFKNGSSGKQPPKNWAKKIQEEWKILEKGLPDEIFVRVYESRMDLLRAVIIGAEGTPYHDGLFFFDVFFPSSYPNVPPQVHYHSGGLRINPNLYNCGKVCLSLLGTWTGSQKEKWIPGASTMLQVLVSIQGLILNAKPYFNEPGYANLSGSASGEKRSLEYNESTFRYNLQTMVYSMRRPPKYFEDFVIGYFCKHAREILVSCKAYLDGAQVGCLVKGGVQDVDEGDKSCSQHFKAQLAGYITVLVNAFIQIGTKDCEEFLSLAQKGNGPATSVPKA